MKPLATYTYTINVQSERMVKNRAAKWLLERIHRLTSRMKRAGRLYGSDGKRSDVSLSEHNDYFPL